MLRCLRTENAKKLQNGQFFKMYELRLGKELLKDFLGRKCFSWRGFFLISIMYVFVHKLIVKILDSIYVGFWLTLCQLNKNGSLQYATRNEEIALN